MRLEWGRAICYSGYRENQHPRDGARPTREQIREDLDIIVNDGFAYIRMYDPSDYAKDVCEIIRERHLPLKLMLGPGILCERNNPGCKWIKRAYTDEELEKRAAENDRRIGMLARMANEYPDVIFAVSVGNENTADWGANTVTEDRLIEFALRLKKETGQFVTFNESAHDWKKLGRLAEHMDIISIHSYPIWNGRTVNEALDANRRDYEDIKKLYPDKTVLFSEAGWTTDCADDAQIVDGEANEEKQAVYYREFLDWIDSEQIIAFLFEAFDEPWKGGRNPREPEKHWGLYDVNRIPKPAAALLRGKKSGF